MVFFDKYIYFLGSEKKYSKFALAFKWNVEKDTNCVVCSKNTNTFTVIYITRCSNRLFYCSKGRWMLSIYFARVLELILFSVVCLEWLG